MKIVHVSNIAGVASDIRDAQVEMGDESLLMAQRRNSTVEPDVPIYLDGFVGINLELLLRGGILRSVDVVHIHGGIRRTQVAFAALRKRSRAVWVIHYHGSETRMGYGIHHQDLADAKVVSTPDLKKWHDDAIWIPNPIPQVFEPEIEAKSIDRTKIKIGHFPSNRAMKGTEKVIKAIAPLMEEGRAELLIKEGRPHREIMQAMRTVDVVIDQLNDLSIFSKTSLEAMAIGIPAISSYDSGIFPSDCPVLRANTEEELNERILEILDGRIDDDLRIRCARYVKKYHHPREIATKLREIYLSK